jgi:regulator of nucleoside diphosphate kinase
MKRPRATSWTAYAGKLISIRSIEIAARIWRKKMNEGSLIITDRDFLRVKALRPEGQLATELEDAIVVPADRLPCNVVTMHSRVRYVDETTGARREIQIVYPEQADPAEGRVSVLAPVGAALLGLAVGQTIEWPFPDGRLRRLRVEGLLFQPESYFSERNSAGGANANPDRPPV